DGVAGEPVVGHAALLAEGDQPVGAQEPELVAHGALVDVGNRGQVAHAQFLLREGAQHAVAGGVGEELEALGGGLDFLWSRQGGLDARDDVGVHEAHLALAAGVDGRAGQRARGPACSFSVLGWKRSSRRALAVTTTVAPVSERMAGHRPVMPKRVVTRKTALRPRANVTFWRMLRMVARDSSIRSLTPVALARSSAAPAVSSATSVPPPMAIPTSACARAGASLMPSPTITTLPSRLRSSMAASLSSGRSSLRASRPR